MKWPTDPLKIDPELSSQAITGFIQAAFQRLNRQQAVLGLSGGLDSCLTAALACRALGTAKVQLIYIPERDSKRIHRQHAKLMAEHLGAELKIINITSPLRKLGVYRLLPLWFFPGQRLKARAIAYGRKEFLGKSGGEFLSARLSASGGSWVARGNAYVSAKHRVRSVLLYKEAERTRGLVIGAANRTEWMTGTFTQWGCDHCADLMPLLHLYRSQLVPQGEYLGLPRIILEKKADPDILPGLDDKGHLLGSFETADQILWGLENGFSADFLYSHFSVEQVDYIQLLVTNSAYYRETPFSLI
jgi:NAD+ synthase